MGRLAWILTLLAAAAGALSAPAAAQATPELRVSAAPDRSASQALAGATLAGKVHVFAVPESGAQARFWLDDPLMAGTPRTVENSAPWDFAGGNSRDGTAKPFDTTTIADGDHTITVAITAADSTVTFASATFTVANDSAEPPPDTGSHALQVSDAANRSAPRALEGATLSGRAYVFASPETGESARFWLDDPGMVGAPRTVENNAPWDFLGGNRDGTALPFDTTTVADGQHTITVAVTAADSSLSVTSASFAVDNGGAEEPPPDTGTHTLLLSDAADRSAPRALDGATLTGRAYIFSSPETGTGARFWLDDPAMSGTPRKVENNAPWDFVGGASNGTALPFDTTTLPDGTHTITVAVTLAGGDVATDTATFAVANDEEEPPPPTGTHTLLVSDAADRSAARALEGATVEGDAYLFATPETGETARFWLDDPAMAGAPRMTENNAPWDFAGGNKDGTAKRFDTTTIADGAHTLTAAVTLADGSVVVVHARFAVANTTTGPALAFDRSAVGFSVAPGGSAAPQSVTLSTVGGAATSFSVSDDASWLTVSPTTGTTPAALELRAATSQLAAGTHTARVTATAPGHTGAILTVTVSVTQPAAPDQVHLAWVEEPSTTMTAVWRTRDGNSPSAVEYRAVGASDWQGASGAVRPSGTSGTLHEATLRGLTPGTAYEYRVAGDGGHWSEVFRFRTAPPPGPADFDAVFFGDTGLIGRTDGLATGTQQIRDLIADMNPLVVLGGGDYAYFNTDKRFGTLENTIDAWFNQSQPFAARSALMPTYGNHEVFLSEGYANWAARFATPEGDDDRRTYSFDVGDAHFISVFAASDGTGGLRSGTEDWIEADVQAARARGARWIVPFLHVAPFADGSSHPSNLDLRADVGPLFERLGVQVALTTHDQSYERTFPLANVPAANAPTSSAKRCYTLEDGVTYLKVSPAGKLSSKNHDFSKFQTFPAPAYTAFRDDTMHHFTRLRFTAGGTMRVETFGVRGDGSAPVVQDAFEYRDGACSPELAFSAPSAALAADQNGTGSAQVSLSSSAGAATFSVSDDAPWLEVTPSSGSTPRTLTLTANAAGLAPGLYDATVTANAPGHLAAQLTVTLAVAEEFRMQVSTASNRSSPQALAGRTVSGTVYPFLVPDAGATRVRFWLDNAAATGTPRTTENNPPWDFVGTASNGAAKPLDTRTLAAGEHTITAIADVTGGGTKTVHTTFRVQN